MLIVNNYNLLFDTHDIKFINKMMNQCEIDDKTYTVDINFKFQNHYTREGLLYYVEIVVFDYDRPIRRIEKYCVLTMDDVGQLNMRNKEYVFNDIIFIHPNDLKAEDISIREF